MSRLKGVVLVVCTLLIVSHGDYSDFVINEINSENIRGHLNTLARVPHVAGTVGDYNTALYVRKHLEDSGFHNVSILNFTTLLQFPVYRSLQIVAPDFYNVSLIEFENLDNYSSNPDIIPTWLGYTGVGEFEGPLVYANYGNEEDFEYLQNKKVDLNNTIVLMRYGTNYRGAKVATAQRYGAVGAIIYSDPYDDGYFPGEPYPKGAWRSASSVERGSLLNLAACTGDPSPDRVATVCNTTIPYVPGIPALPISYGQAEWLLQSLRTSGTPVEVAWQGGLPFHYHYGPGNTRVRISVKAEWKNVTCWNVRAEIPGTDVTEKSQIVGFGNHRDAWTFGAADPSSGTATMLEVARVLGLAVQNGWRPRRTIQFFSWDTEEWGLIGSTQYGEAEADALMRDMVVYLNLDTAVKSSNPILSLQASGSLIEFLQSEKITGKIIDPNTQKPMNQVWDRTVGILGSGSDYAVFMNHLGIPCLDASFRGRSRASAGTYHSKYDDLDWMERYVDPQFVYHRTMAQLYALMVYHFADDPVVPFGFREYAGRLRTETDNLMVTVGGIVDSGRLYTALENFNDAAERVEEEVADLGDQGNAATRGDLNQRLVFTERQFLSAGIPGRPWFRNVLQAPGLGKGYSSVSFPGVVDAAWREDWTAVGVQVEVLTEKINSAANFLRGSERVIGLAPAVVAGVVVVAVLLAVLLVAAVAYMGWVRKKRRDYRLLSGQ